MIIKVTQNKEYISKADLKLIDKNVILQTDAFIGLKGTCEDKKEGDKRTPCGTFNLGIAFGTHLNIDTNLKYIKLNKNLYWVDDTNSFYYNQLVDITKVQKDWVTAEHLIEYPVQYEYGIEIKTNPNNEKGKGSAIFLHCSNNKPTAGCIAIKRDKMEQLLKLIDKDTLIEIKSYHIN